MSLSDDLDPDRSKSHHLVARVTWCGFAPEVRCFEGAHPEPVYSSKPVGLSAQSTIQNLAQMSSSDTLLAFSQAPCLREPQVSCLESGVFWTGYYIKSFLDAILYESAWLNVGSEC